MHLSFCMRRQLRPWKQVVTCVVVAAIVAWGSVGPARCAPLTPGNILIIQDTIREATLTGETVQTLLVPGPVPPGPLGEAIRDAAVTADGRLAVYRGTFDPLLTVFDQATGSFQSFNFPGWSTTGTLVGGGIAALGHVAFATDMNAGSGPQNGLIRFDTVTGAGQRFAAGMDFIDVTIGLDGRLYGLQTTEFPGGRRAFVYDPVTLQQLDRVSVSMPGDPEATFALAVNGSGGIFAGSGFLGGPGSRIIHFSPNGEALAVLTLPGTGIVGLDLDVDGNLVAISADGRVFLTTEALTSFTELANTRTGFDLNVAFVPRVVVPEPSSLSLLGLGVCSLLASGRRCWTRREEVK